MKNKITAIIITIMSLMFSVNAFAETALIDKNYEPLKMKTVKQEGKLLFSDSPEYLEEFGIVAKAKIKGNGKIYYYHVNDKYVPGIIAIFAQGKANQKTEIKRIVKGDASIDYITTGKTLSERLTNGEGKCKKEIVLANKEKTILEDTIEYVKPEYLVSGMVDVYSKDEMTYGVVFLPKIGKIENSLKNAKEIAVDKHEMRGTFSSDIYLENEKPWNISNGPAEIKIGDGKRDVFLQGMDEIDKVKRENTGNFGVTYHINIHSKGKGKYSVYLNPQGGVYMGIIEIGQGYVYYPYNTEIRSDMFGHNTIYDYMNMGIWEAGKDLKIRLTPPGASNLPIRLLLIPQ